MMNHFILHLFAGTSCNSCCCCCSSYSSKRVWKSRLPQTSLVWSAVRAVTASALSALLLQLFQPGTDDTIMSI